MAGINRDTTTAPNGSGNTGRDGSGPGLLGMKARYVGGTWEPTVLYLILLMFLEVIAYGLLRYLFKGVHGG